MDVTSLRRSVSGTSLRLVHAAGSLVYIIPVGAGSVYLRGGYGKLRPNCAIGVTPYCNAHGAIIVAAGFRSPMARALQLRAEGMIHNRSAYQYTSFGTSVGLTVLTSSGGRSSRGSGPDADGDGVFNGIDRCPTTPKGTSVDPIGCPVQKPD